MSEPRNNWRTTMLLFALTSVIESLAFGHLSAFTPLYLEQLDVPRAAIGHWTGVLSSVGWVFGLPLLPFWGVLADRFGRKIIIIRSSVFAVLIYALSALAPNVMFLAAARFLGGFVLGNTGVMMAVQSEITPKERLGTAVSIISAGSPIGMAVGPLFGGKIVGLYGVRALLWVDTILTILVVLLLILMLKEEKRGPVSENRVRDDVKASMRAIFTLPAIRNLFLVVFFLAMGLNVAQPYVALFIGELYRGDRLPETIGLVLSATGVTMVVATPLWGPIGDRFGHLKVLRVASLLTFGALAGQAFAAGWVQLGGFRAWQGLCQGGLSALTMVLLATYSPTNKRSSILAMSLFPQQMAWFLGPLVGSILIGGGTRVVFIASAIAMLVGFVGTLLLRPPVESGVEER